MYDDFIRAFIAKSNKGKPATESQITKAKSTFAGNTNKRGVALVERLKSLGIELKGKNVLDVGCAYGGLSIKASRAGANVIGIDTVDYLIDFANIIAKGGVPVDFNTLDATSPELICKIGINRQI